MSKGGRLSRLFPKIFKIDKTKTNNADGVFKGPSCSIIFLDDSEQVFTYKSNWKGQILFDQICDMINLSEKAYFGLRFVDASSQAHWLDLAKSVSSQLKGCSTSHPKLYFGVKFYSADPCKLREEITRYLFFLQVKRDILQGRLPVSFDDAAELCAYAVQSELGDFDPRVHTPGYVSEFSFLPNQTEELEAKISGMHRRCQGATPVMAEQKFLEKVKWLEMYGVDLHPVLDTSNVEYFLGLTPTGIVVYKHRNKISSHFWPRVTKASHKGKIFTIRVKDKNNDEHIYAFELSTKCACKHLWKCCVEHHTFFSERSERLAANESKSRDGPRVYRAPSRRKARRINSDSRHNSEQLYQDLHVNGQMSVVTVVGQPEPVRVPKHRSLPELHGRQSPRSVKSAPWESKFDHGLYTSGHDSPTSGRQTSFISVGSDSESGISQRKRYFPSRKGSDNESDASASRRRRRREMDSDSASEISFTNSGYNRRNHLGHRNIKASDSHLANSYHDKENNTHGSIPSIQSAPVGEVRQRRRRRQNKSPGNSKRPPEELKQHIEFGLVDTEGLTDDQLRDIPYTKVETKANLFRIKYSPKFRQKIWASRRRSYESTWSGNREGSGSNLSRHDHHKLDSYPEDAQNNRRSNGFNNENVIDAEERQQEVMSLTSASRQQKGYSSQSYQSQVHSDSKETAYDSSSSIRMRRDYRNNRLSDHEGSSVIGHKGYQSNNVHNRLSYHEQSRKPPIGKPQQIARDSSYLQNQLELDNYHQEFHRRNSNKGRLTHLYPDRYAALSDSYSPLSSKQDSYKQAYNNGFNWDPVSRRNHPGNTNDSNIKRSEIQSSDKYIPLSNHESTADVLPRTVSTPPKHSETPQSISSQRGTLVQARYNETSSMGSQRTHTESPRYSETHTESPRYSETQKDPPRYSETDQQRGIFTQSRTYNRMNFGQGTAPLRPRSDNYEDQFSYSRLRSNCASQTNQPETASFSSHQKNNTRHTGNSYNLQFDERQPSQVSQYRSSHHYNDADRSPHSSSSHNRMSQEPATLRRVYTQPQQQATACSMHK